MPKTCLPSDLVTRSSGNDFSFRPGTRSKLLRIVLDLSGSMYYFNSHDGRLERSLQAAVMLLEALAGFEHKYSYALVGHSGDTPCLPLVQYGAPPKNEKERLQVALRMAAHSQFCLSGDNTLQAAREAVTEAASHTECEEAFVFLLSDANLERYGIQPSELARVLTSEPRVHAHAVFLSSLGGAAERLKAALPAGRSSICLDSSEVPKAIHAAFKASVLRDI